MKNILFLLIFATTAQAQTTTKSFTISPDSINYFEIIRVTDDETGSYTESATMVGPVAQIAQDQADKILGRMESLANAAYVVSKTNARINEEKAVAATVLALTGIDPLKEILARLQAVLLVAGWTIDPGTGYVPIVFTVNAQNNLRYSVNGAATKAADIYGNIIRLNNYPETGTDTDFFRAEDGGQYFSLPNRAMKIKKP